MNIRTTAASGQPFNLPKNNATNSVSGSWTKMGNIAPGKGVRVQGIYWSCVTPGAVLKIRDVIPNVGTGPVSGVTWYEAICTGGEPVLDQLSNNLTLYSPFEYFDSEGGNVIIIYGEYV